MRPDDYLSKPVRKKDLKETVFKWVYKNDSQEAREEDHEEETETHSEEKTEAQKNTEGQSDRENRIDTTPTTGQIPSSRAQNIENISETPNDILDLEAVSNARNILKDKYQSMVTVYIDNSRARIEELNKAIDDNDIEGLIRPAHTLKSTSKQMGAAKMALTAQNLEKTVKSLVQNQNTDQNNIENIKQSAANLRKILKETQKAFDTMAA